MRVIFFVAAAIVVTYVLLTSWSSPSIKPLKENAVIVAFGDSLTQGVGVEKAQSYPAVLQSLTGHKVVNAGIAGETTTEGVQRFDAVLEQYQPELVILLEGGNDILQNVSAESIQANLSKMIEMAKVREVAVVLVGVPEKRLFGGVAPFYAELADVWQIPLEDGILSHLMMRTSMKSDPVHFNEKGYQKLAEAIYETLQSSGAL